MTRIHGVVALGGIAAGPAGTGVTAGVAITPGNGVCAVGGGCAESVAVTPQTPMTTGTAKSNKARSDETAELNA